MIKEFLKQVEKESFFELSIFNDQILIRGRLLSPSESEAASLSSTLLVSQIASAEEGKKLGDLRNLSEELNSGNASDEAIDRAYSFLKALKPHQLIQISEQQNKIICQVIKKASMNKGESWDRIQIVMTQEEQNAEQNRLWVGMISGEDRTLILNKAMQGHTEAVEKLCRFRAG